MKTAEYIDHVKAQRNAAIEREGNVRKALRRFLSLALRHQDDVFIKQNEWDDAIIMAQEALNKDDTTPQVGG